jgi:hypothetical protein
LRDLGSPFIILESAGQQSNAGKKFVLGLGALAVASIAVGLTFLIVTDSDAKWCTKANRDDPGCKHRGGE